MTIKEQVKKEHDRIMRGVYSAMRRGYVVPGTDIYKTLKIPNPKTPSSKTLSALKKINISDLYKKLEYVTKTGKVVSGLKGREIERSESAKKAAATRKRKSAAKKAENTVILPNESEEVLKQIRMMVESWAPNPQWQRVKTGKSLEELKRNDINRLTNILSGAIEREGKQVVARRLQQNAREITEIVERILYASGDSYRSYGRDGVNRDLVRFASVLKGAALTLDERIDLSNDEIDEIL